MRSDGKGGGKAPPNNYMGHPKHFVLHNIKRLPEFSKHYYQHSHSSGAYFSVYGTPSSPLYLKLIRSSSTFRLTNVLFFLWHHTTTPYTTNLQQSHDASHLRSHQRPQSINFTSHHIIPTPNNTTRPSTRSNQEPPNPPPWSRKSRPRYLFPQC